MKVFVSTQVALLAFTVSLSVCVTNWASEKIAEPFPMSVGTYWIYRGVVRWTDETNRPAEAKVEWKTQVRRTIHHGEYSAAIINGFPSDLDWSDGNPVPADSLLIRLGKDRFYLPASQQLAEDVKRLEDPRDSLKGLLDENDLFLQLPLSKGKKFCAAEGTARPDGHYCWVVESSKSVSLEDVIGSGLGVRTSYRVVYVTNPDDEEFDFVSGIGLISYGYHHHGTVADTEVRLSEFHSNLNSHE